MSEVRALVIDRNGSHAVVSIEPELSVLQSLVGGYIEVVAPAFGGFQWHAYVDEDGKAAGEQINVMATALLARLGWSGPMGGDFLVGPVIVLGQDGAEEADVPDEVLAVARRFFADEA